MPPITRHSSDASPWENALKCKVAFEKERSESQDAILAKFQDKIDANVARAAEAINEHMEALRVQQGVKQQRVRDAEKKVMQKREEIAAKLKRARADLLDLHVQFQGAYSARKHFAQVAASG